MDEEKDNEEADREVMCCFEEFVVSVSVESIRSWSDRSGIAYRMGPIDIMLSHACGMRAATPVQ